MDAPCQHPYCHRRRSETGERGGDGSAAAQNPLGRVGKRAHANFYSGFNLLLHGGASGASLARAQATTGSITGNITDASGALLPGVRVSLTGQRLIGGAQLQTTDADGNYRFDRLPPGAYDVKFEMQGFKTIERSDIRINAAFVASVPGMKVGAVVE